MKEVNFDTHGITDQCPLDIPVYECNRCPWKEAQHEFTVLCSCPEIPVGLVARVREKVLKTKEGEAR